MKNKLFLLFGVAVALVLLCYMFVFQLAFNEVAVKATLGSADNSSVINDAGFHVRLPWPFQQVHKYSTRTQIVETALDQIQTSDEYAVIARMYMTWKVQEPLAYFQTLKNDTQAKERLSTLLRDASGAFGNRKFNELVNTDASKLKLAEIEKAMLTAVSAEAKQYGITVEHVGIRRVVLPETVTSKVFERMKSDRENRAANVRTRGTAAANAIVSEAKSIKATILSFANRYAEVIRTRGRTQAAEVYKEFKQDEDLAILLGRMETLQKILGKNSFFIIDVTKADAMSPFGLLATEPDQAAAKVPLRPATP